jgi:hypothetical protein
VRRTLGIVVWLAVGVIIAHSHHYLSNVNSVKPLVSAILAVLLWPLFLLGINLHIR